MSLHFNPRSPWGERPTFDIFKPDGVIISIHAPRGGSDNLWVNAIATCEISIHAPRGGSDGYTSEAQIMISDFNPRSPWGERRAPLVPLDRRANFNPRSPWGERLGSNGQSAVNIDFNPRSPWGERLVAVPVRVPVLRFQSTLPVGGATKGIARQNLIHKISIHAPRGGSDVS